MRALLAALLSVACGGSQPPTAPKRSAPAVAVAAPASAAPAGKPPAITAAEGRWEWTEAGALWIGGSTISLWQLDPLRLLAQLSTPDTVACADVSPSLALLLATTSTKTRFLWDVALGAAPTSIPDTDEPLQGCIGTWLPGEAWTDFLDQDSIILRHRSGRVETINDCASPGSSCVGMSLDGSWFHVVDRTGVRLQRSGGHEVRRLRGTGGFWTSSAAFVAINGPETAYWDAQAGRRQWIKRGMRAFSASPESDRLLVLHGDGDACEVGTWSVLSSSDGHSMATFKRKDKMCCPAFAWAPQASGSSTLVFSDGFRIHFVGPEGRVDTYPVQGDCSGPIMLGKGKLTAGEVVVDLASRSFGKLEGLSGNAELSPGDDFVAGSRIQGVTIWDARTQAVVAEERGLSSGDLRWVSPSALLYSPPASAWLCLLSAVDPRELCLTVVDQEQERLVLALADDGTYSLPVNQSSIERRLKELRKDVPMRRVCPDLLSSYLRGEQCTPTSN